MGMDVASVKAHSSARHELRSSGSDILSVNLAPAAPGNRKKYTSEGFASLTLQRRTFDLHDATQRGHVVGCAAS
jgi:hypothetical protein